MLNNHQYKKKHFFGFSMNGNFMVKKQLERQNILPSAEG